MKKLNTFYILGTTGIIITGILQIFLALILDVGGTLSSFMPVYMTWLTFLILGTANLIKRQKVTKK